MSNINPAQSFNSEALFDVPSLRELLKRRIEPQRAILMPWLREQSLAMVYAKRGVGKTWFALSVAMAAAAGEAFGPWEAPELSKVLYLDGEMPLIAMQERARAFNRTGLWLAARDNLRLFMRDTQSQSMPDIATPAGQAALQPYTALADLIVVDNLSTLARSGVENEREAWVPIADWLLSLRSKRKAVLLVHHAGKGGDQRGSSAREDILDVSLKLENADDHTAEDGACFNVHFEKARGLFGADVQPHRLKLQSGTDGGLLWASESVAPLKRDRIVALLKEGWSQREVARELETASSYVNRISQELNAERGRSPFPPKEGEQGTPTPVHCSQKPR